MKSDHKDDLLQWRPSFTVIKNFFADFLTDSKANPLIYKGNFWFHINTYLILFGYNHTERQRQRQHPTLVYGDAWKSVPDHFISQASP